jgi:hypothetical protein
VVDVRSEREVFVDCNIMSVCGFHFVLQDYLYEIRY